MKLADNWTACPPGSNGKPLPPTPPGTLVRAGDRNNFGTVTADNGATCTVHFISPEGQAADVELPKSSLRKQDGSPLDPSAGVDIGPPVPVGQIIADHPRLRPVVVDGFLRRAEVGNIIADPKRGKSWLGYGLAFAVADGFSWLDTFPWFKAMCC